MLSLNHRRALVDFEDPTPEDPPSEPPPEEEPDPTYTI